MQTELNLFSGEYLRDCGILQAQLSADNQTENWSGKAFDYLRFYIKHNKQFMTEDVRISSEGIIEMPPSNRAWGGVIVRAVKSGLIKRIGFQNVTNPKAHKTPATLWESLV